MQSPHVLRAFLCALGTLRARHGCAGKEKIFCEKNNSPISELLHIFWKRKFEIEIDQWPKPWRAKA
ncbi:hypothetical protein AMR75_19225 [Vibrio fluvialis]|nr:hypothetical protein AMR75_19225 [Vibrio fluvialis]